MTPDSDWDIYLVVQSDEDAAGILDRLVGDIPPGRVEMCGAFTVEAFEAHAATDHADEWNRYNFAHLVPSLDRTPGQVLQRLCDEKESLPERVAAVRCPGLLDAFLNSYYRALKNQRDGDPNGATLDTIEAVPRLLDFVFTAERRVRPYNKFLGWELDIHPLERQWWPASDAPLRLREVATSGHPRLLAPFFEQLELQTRSLGLDDVLDAWGSAAVTFMREGRIVR